MTAIYDPSTPTNCVKFCFEKIFELLKYDNGSWPVLRPDLLLDDPDAQSIRQFVYMNHLNIPVIEKVDSDLYECSNHCGEFYSIYIENEHASVVSVNLGVIKKEPPSVDESTINRQCWFKINNEVTTNLEILLPLHTCYKNKDGLKCNKLIKGIKKETELLQLQNPTYEFDRKGHYNIIFRGEGVYRNRVVPYDVYKDYKVLLALSRNE